MVKSTFEVQGITISHKRFNEDDFINLTDMAKFKDPEKTGHVIIKWLSTRYTIEFMGIWEKCNNPNFNVTEFGNIKNESGSQSFFLTTTQWKEKTNAIGIVSNAGRYGGTFAHKDIAFEFATWLSAEFKYYIIQEFQRLKVKEQAQLQWTARRELTKLNYHIHTDAIKENIVPTLTEQQKQFVYQDEADVLNVALFGFTAKQWRDKNPDKAKTENARDYATIHQLLVLANMESYNAEMIKEGLPQKERIQKLNDMARYQLPILMQSNSLLLK
jgi:hypothetical protein